MSVWLPGFQVLLDCIVKEVTSLPRGPLLESLPQVPLHTALWAADYSLLIDAAPCLTQLHHTALFTAPRKGLCAVLRRQTWVQTQLPILTCSAYWISPCVSQDLSVSPLAHWRLLWHILLGRSSGIGGITSAKVEE